MKNFRIGVAVPCRVGDVDILERYCIPSLARLNPRPYATMIAINEGHRDGLKGVKTDLYDHLFNEFDVDVILCVDADMMLFRDVLKFVKRNVIVDFPHIVRAPLATMFKMVIRMLVNKPLCGCLSIPRELWEGKIRDNPEFNGIDSSIIRSVDIRRDFFPLKFPPKFMLMRRSKGAYRKTMLNHPKNRELGAIKRMIYLTGTLPF